MNLLLAACSIALVMPAPDDPHIDLRAYQAGPYDAEVGRLAVPENRSDTGTREIQLAVLRLTSTAADPGPPLFVLPGGPGNSATALGGSPVWGPMLEMGDVVLMDPRGVNRSEPDLAWSSEAIAPGRLFGGERDATAHMQELCAAAAAHFRDSGVDLRGFNTIEMADDIDALRRALGYDEVNLLGHSFGTHLGLAIIRRHPGTVARFVSVGTAGTGDMMKLPSDVDRSLETLARVVAADPVVGADMPDFADAVRRAIAGLERDPLPVPVTDPATGATSEIMLGAFGLQLILLADLGDTSDLPVFPRLVRSIEERDPRIVSWFLAKRMRQFSNLPVLMLTVRASSGATAERWSRIRREAEGSPFGSTRCLFSPAIDEPLGLRDVGDAFRTPVRSDVPTLFVSGTLDAHTPPFQADRVRSGFTNAGHLVVTNGGHEDLLPDPNVQRAIRAFLSGASPRDLVIDRPQVRFAPITGPLAGFDHPALAAVARDAKAGTP